LRTVTIVDYPNRSLIVQAESLILKKFLFLLFLVIVTAFSGCHRISDNELSDVESAIESKDYNRALTTLSQLAEKYKGDAIVHYLSGYCFLKKEDNEAALKAFKRTFDIRKNYSAMVGDVDVANFLAGNSLSAENPFFKGAMRELDTIVSKNSGGETEERIRYHKASLLLLKDKYDKAIDELEKIIENKVVSPYDAKAYLKIGEITAQYLQNEDKGLSIISALIDKYPNDRETLAESMIWIAEYKIKRANMLKKRIESLEDFIESWKGIKGFQEDIKEAVVQIGSDSKSRNKCIAEAKEYIDKINREYAGSNFAERTKMLLSGLNAVNR